LTVAISDDDGPARQRLFPGSGLIGQPVGYDMFAKWIGRHARKNALSVRTLSQLGPYVDQPTAGLEAMLGLVEQFQVEAGTLSDQLPIDRNVFLSAGSIRIRTRSKSDLLLKADTPQARYPLPSTASVSGLYAMEPCELLAIPRPAATRQDRACAHLPGHPELTADEAVAMQQLRAHFHEAHCELPSLPDLALKIGQAIDDPKNDNEHIARLIQLDPSLTARMLSVVNSAAFGGLSKITSISQATARLGRHKVRSLVFSCLLKGIFEASSPALEQRAEALWQHALSIAALAFVLGRATPGIDAEQALLAGLIHDIGAVAIIGGVSHFPALTRRKQVLDYIIASMRTELGLRTLRQWRLHSEFRDVIKDAQNWQRVGSAIPEYPDVVVLAQLHAMIGTPEQPRLPRIDTIPAFFKLARGELTPRHSLSVLEEAEADVREVRTLIGTA
jgi:HD-like signal output (HDOD) protein